MKFVVILLILLVTLLSSKSSVADFPIAKPNCENRCGNIDIPFPFGTTPACYLSPDYLVECRGSSGSSKKLFWDSTIEIASISLDGQLRIMQPIADECYDGNGTRISNTEATIPLSSFTVNTTANKFTVVGCDTSGYVEGRRAPVNYGKDRISSGALTGGQSYYNSPCAKGSSYKGCTSTGNGDPYTRDCTKNGQCRRNALEGGRFTYRTGCYATCATKDELSTGSCDGSGCCQTSISKRVSKTKIVLTSTDNYNDVWNFSRCGFAFIAEGSAFNFSAANLTNLRNVTSLPMVVDWGIINGNCSTVNSSTTACKSVNSMCEDLGNVIDQYRCFCEEGYEGNPYLVDGCRDIDECQDPSRNDCITNQCKNNQGGYECFCPTGYRGDGKRENGKGCTHELVLKLATGISSGIIFLLLLSGSLSLFLKRRKLAKTRQQYFDQNGGKLLKENLKSTDTLKIFSESELKKAANYFKKGMIIGEGGSGTVYKGILRDNSIVAIKKSKEVDDKNKEEFSKEVRIVSTINHTNAVKLLGCCLETQVPLLVYEFISNGTLSEHIHNKAKADFLTWDRRLRIATETAGVLSYLHYEASTPIIHRDVKSSNILLDDTFTAKVSDFGTSRFVPRDKTRANTLVQGTLGYLDPEYNLKGLLTEKSDVYSFGVVLVELLTGRMAMSDDGPEEERMLANFFVTKKEEELFQVFDDVVKKGNEKLVVKVAKLAIRCLNVKGDERPSMKDVARELEGLMIEVKMVLEGPRDGEP